jgi:tRNA (guanine37-N1)-methyltransferase
VTQIEILTIFPDLFGPFVSNSLIGKACSRSILSINLLNIRDFTPPPHHHVDDVPYGGGAGMLFKPEPLTAAIEDAKKRLPNGKVILTTPAGKLFKQGDAARLAKQDQIIFICGRYEGIDDRVRELFVDESFSIGDFVLMGGEVPAMAMIEAIVRLQDTVLGNSESIIQESFSDDSSGRVLLEPPQYTRPALFRGLKVPEVLLSGDPKKIELWRKEEALKRTKLYRPDLLEKVDER